MTSTKQSSAVVGVDIAEIDPELRPASQTRAKYNPQDIEDFANNIDQLPPVELMYDPEIRQHWLVDGSYRTKAALSAGRTTVQATVTQGSYEDAFTAAAHANQGNLAVRISEEDKKRLVQEALKISKFSVLSDREVAKICGVSSPFVKKIRRAIKSQNQPNACNQSTVNDLQLNPCNQPNEQKSPVNESMRLGADGKYRPASQPRKPRKPKDELNPNGHQENGKHKPTPQEQIQEPKAEEHVPETATSHHCPNCDIEFTEPVWHCPGCDHHWRLSDVECHECHQFGRGDDGPVRALTTTEEGLKSESEHEIFDEIEDIEDGQSPKATDTTRTTTASENSPQAGPVVIEIKDLLAWLDSQETALLQLYYHTCPEAGRGLFVQRLFGIVMHLKTLHHPELICRVDMPLEI